MRRKRVIVVFLFLLCLVSSLRAQLVSIPYSMSFEEEDSLEFQNWVLNPGPKDSLCEDHWVVGTATKNDGRYSLYVSNDGGEMPFFGTNPNVQYAYRDFQFPGGYYEFSFDWRCVGSGGSALYVGFGFPMSGMEANNNGSVVPSAVKRWYRTTKALNGYQQWSNFSFSETVKPNTTYRLYFVWTSANTDTTLTMPVGGCIDNIQITSGDCVRPSVVTATATCDSVSVKWKGTSQKYSMEYRMRGIDKWRVMPVTTETSCTLEGLDDGLYDFRVRGICNDSNYSAYTYLNSFVVYCPEKHCIDYVNLKDNPNITTTIGDTKDPYRERALIDEGYDDMYKRHTVNWDINEYDARTGNRLPLVPDGELASVRLGNWDINAQAESVSYSYTVDAENAAILLLKYAVILEDPGHPAANQPRFKLEILDKDSVPVDLSCGAADFHADKKRLGNGWHVNEDAACPVTWKEWTTIGLNLEEYDGQTLIIRLTTYDCSQSGHFGYAYFTLGCAAAKIQGSSCGDDEEMVVNAPEGFDYTWYDRNNNVVGHDRNMTLAPNDTATYRCHLSYKESPDCGFDLVSSSKPRFPYSDFTYTQTPAGCVNKVTFTNKSHVITVVDGNVSHTSEACEEFAWNFDNGVESSEKNPVITFPNEGGTFEVTLLSYIAGGRCVDDTVIDVVVLPIGDTEQKVDTIICEGNYVTLGDKKSVGGQQLCADPGEYTVLWKSVAGCDSSIVYNLSVVPRPMTQLPDTTVCAEEPLIVDGRTYKFQTTMKQGEFYLEPYYRSMYGCDSIVWMNVTVLDSILPTIRMVDVDGDKQHSGELHFGGTGYSYYLINGERHDSTDTDIIGLNGGTFVIEFFNDFGCSVVRTEEMTYPCRNLIFQRWGDVLSVMNAEAQKRRSADMPAEEFTSFQWMKDDVDIPGETLSYYYTPDGLDLNAEYRVRVVTVSGETLVSCPYKPVEYKASGLERRKIIENQALVIIINGVRYNAQGRRIQ